MLIPALLALTLTPSARAQNLEKAYARALSELAVSGPCADVKEIDLEVWSGTGGVTYRFLGRQIMPGDYLCGKTESPRGKSPKSYDATIDAAKRIAILNAVNTKGFFALDDEYREAKITDGTIRTITVTCSDGRRKSVRDANKSGPASLRSAEAALESLASGLFWVD
jgi:hypothetical protein